MLAKLEKFQEAYDLTDEEFEAAQDQLRNELNLRKSQLNALLDWYENEIDLGAELTDADVQKTIDAITRKGWNQ